MSNKILKPCRCGGIPELLFDVVQDTYYKPYIHCQACGERVEHPSHVSWGYKKSADLIVSDKRNSGTQLYDDGRIRIVTRKDE